MNHAINRQVLSESRLRSFSITVEEYQHQVEQKLQNSNYLQDNKHFLNCDPPEKYEVFLDAIL